MRSLRPRAILLVVVSSLALLRVASASHSLVDRVKDGPAAAATRQSYRCLELGEASDDDATKLDWYRRGKEFADTAVREDERSAEAHFALFANWGRWLQTDGWLKNSLRLPALRRELDRALELDPNHPDALAAEGGLYLQLPRFLGGDASKAEPLLVRSIALDPEAVGARLELADYYYRQSRRDAARDLASTALRLAIQQGKTRFIRRADNLLQQIGPPSEHAEALAR